MAGQVVQRAARGGHVHEPEQRGPQLARRPRPAPSPWLSSARSGWRAPDGNEPASVPADSPDLRLETTAQDRIGSRMSARPRSSARCSATSARTRPSFWVETDSACEVEVLGAKRAHLLRRGPPLRARARRPASSRGDVARVRGAARRRAASGPRRTRSSRPAGFRTYPQGRAAELIFGSCRVTAPHEPPVLAAQGRGPARARASTRCAAWRGGWPSTTPDDGPTCCCCSATRSTPTRSRRRPWPTSSSAATRTRSPAGGWSTTRSTRASTARPGASPRSAGCSRWCRRR